MGVRQISPEEREYRAQLAIRLHGARKARGWSLAELERRSGVSRVQLSGYESVRRTPFPFTLDRLARVLDVSPGWLLSGPKEARKAQREMICSTKATMGPEMIDPEFRNRGTQVQENGGTEQ